MPKRSKATLKRASKVPQMSLSDQISHATSSADQANRGLSLVNKIGLDADYFSNLAKARLTPPKKYKKSAVPLSIRKLTPDSWKHDGWMATSAKRLKRNFGLKKKLSRS